MWGNGFLVVDCLGVEVGDVACNWLFTFECIVN